MHALRPLHILWRYVAYGCLPWFLYGLLFRLLPVKRETVGSTAFGVVMEILLWSVMIPATAFVVAPADRRVQGRTAFIHIVCERTPVPAVRTGMPCCRSFIFL